MDRTAVNSLVVQLDLDTWDKLLHFGDNGALDVAPSFVFELQSGCFNDASH
jgi:hypothetical protein